MRKKEFKFHIFFTIFGWVKNMKNAIRKNFIVIQATATDMNNLPEFQNELLKSRPRY